MSTVTSHESLKYAGLDFMWIELTSRCNLACIHCYAESSPKAGSSDTMKPKDYERVIREAAAQGCRKLQFIGGEPTLVRELPEYIELAKRLGVEHIEVFTNATFVTKDLLECFVRNQVHVATSFYSWNAGTHDAITTKRGSQQLTLNTLKRYISAGLRVRAGIILMDGNRDHAEKTADYLRESGVTQVGFDNIRPFGRGVKETKVPSNMRNLCGNCWKQRICISPTGEVSPCIMSKTWSVGSVHEASLEHILISPQLRDIRLKIDQATSERHHERRSGRSLVAGCYPDADCTPKESCKPDDKCGPDTAPCHPDWCSPDMGECMPDDTCHPTDPCNPTKGW